MMFNGAQSLLFGRKLIGAILLGTGMLGATPPALAEPTKIESKLSLSFLGVGVGKMKSGITVSDDKYTIGGVISTNAVVSIIAKTDAKFYSRGRFKGTVPVPAGHRLTYTQKKEKGSVLMAFSKGNVRKTTSTPKVKYKTGAIVPKKSDLQAVLDPVSSLLFRVAPEHVGNGARVCNRTVKVYDGKNRLNLVSRLKSKGRASVKGFKGDVFTCQLRYKMIAGLHPRAASVKFMTANKDIEITMARVGKTNVYALFGFRVKTRRGTAVGKAYKFGLI